MQREFPFPSVVNPSPLPGDVVSVLDALRAAPKSIELARLLYAYCELKPDSWPRVWKFLRVVMTPGGVAIVSRLAESARDAIKRGKPVPFGSDRFARWVAFEHDLKGDNTSWPLYLATVACAFPALAPSLTIETDEAKIIFAHDWNPLQPFTDQA